MAHTTGRAAAALALTAGLAVGFAQPAGAQVNPGYQNTPRRSVTQDANWETLSNLPMTTVFALPGYGWRAEFTVTVGARWDSGLFGGQPWGNVEGRAEVRSRGRIVSPALIAVHVVPAFNGQWLARCQAHISG